MRFLLNVPSISNLEKKYVNDVLNNGWLSINGDHTKAFERKISKFVKKNYCVAVQSGTAAIHASLKAAGVKKGDKVITPNYTCVSNVSCISQLNAIPIVVEIENQTLGLDYNAVYKAIKLHKPKVLQIVHVYGHPAKDTLKIIKLCKKKNITVIEDASESLGAKIKKNRTGYFGDISVFSTRSEKMIGSGEGGVILTNNKKLYDKILLYCSRHAPFRKKTDPYWKKYYVNGEGYNYLMPHLTGAFARAQIERFEKNLLKKKIFVGKLYSKLFKENTDYKIVQKKINYTKPVYWLNAIYFKKLTKNKVKKLGYFLMKNGIEVRSGFWPLAKMKNFNSKYVGYKKNSDDIFNKIIVLPSNIYLKEKDIKYIKNKIDLFLKK